MSPPLLQHLDVNPPPLERLGASHPDVLRLVDGASGGGTPVMILHIDFDHFTSVNENMSHRVGDQALILIARRLRHFLGQNGHLWRHGSDELIIVAQRTQQTQSAETFAQHIRAQLEIPLPVLPYTLFLTGKIGVSLCPEHATSLTRLLDFAEEACLQAGRAGGNRVHIYNHNDFAYPPNEGIINRQIIEAIPRNELRIRYQPMVSAHDGRIVGIETLLRWQSPTFGLLIPERFMRTAERLGVIIQIGEWVLQQAIAQMKIWRDQGFDDIFMSINVSTLQLLRPSFYAEIMAMLNATGVPAQAVSLEINESALSHHVHGIYETMVNLRQQGMSLCLDHFGTGDSSLSALIRYPVDQLKIDRSFIKAAPAGSRESAIARAIIAMGHQLGMTVIASGVESRAHIGFLRRNDCDIFQGYHFGDPMSAESIGMALRRRYLRAESFAESRADRTLLLLDDEENVLRSLIRLFRRDSYRILAAGNVRDAFDLLATNDVQVILSDQRMSDMNGTEFLGRVKMLYPNTIRLILSGYTDLSTVTEAINRGAIYRFLTKPWNDDHLRENIRQAFRTFDEQHSNRDNDRFSAGHDAMS